MIFCGSAPAISGKAFYKVTAKAYYPDEFEGTTTWTSDKQRSYGGTLTWQSWYTLGSKVNCRHTYTDSVVSPTCAWGYTLHTCECGYSYRTDFVPATGHDLTKTDEVPATCAENGTKAYWTCGTCAKHFSDAEGKNEIEDLTAWLAGDGKISATGHSLVPVHEVPATCAENGTKAYWTCENCAKNFVDEAGTTEIEDLEAWLAEDGKLSATGHSLAETKEVPASCTKSGTKAYWHCSGCGKYFSDAEGKNAIEDLAAWKAGSGKIAAKGHTYRKTVVAPKGTQPGYTLYTCSVCNHSYKDNYVYTRNAWVLENGKYYYMNSAGKKATGWIYVNGNYYFMNASGVMQTGWVSNGGAWYYMSASGAMQTGWVYVNGNYYYMSASGAMQTGWVYVNGNYYYMSASGAMQTGWVLDGGAWYYMSASGAMSTGWIYVNGNYYYMGTSGAMQTGWVLDGGAWYYMNESGVMCTGAQVINGKTYYFNTSGVWIG